MLLQRQALASSAASCASSRQFAAPRPAAVNARRPSARKLASQPSNCNWVSSGKTRAQTVVTRSTTAPVQPAPTQLQAPGKGISQVRLRFRHCRIRPAAVWHARFNVVILLFNCLVSIHMCPDATGLTNSVMLTNMCCAAVELPQLNSSLQQAGACSSTCGAQACTHPSSNSLHVGIIACNRMNACTSCPAGQCRVQVWRVLCA